jgi:hypothetical protein
MRGMYRKNLAALAFTVSPTRSPDGFVQGRCTVTPSKQAMSIGTFAEPCGAVRCEHLIGPVN